LRIILLIGSLLFKKPGLKCEQFVVNMIYEQGR